MARHLIAAAAIWFWASYAQSVESIVIRNLNKDEVKLPSSVTIRPFRACDVGAEADPGEISRPVLFQGKVTVPIQVYLAAVIIGEIRTANELVPEGTDRKLVPLPSQSEAFHAQAQAALNCLLYRIAVSSKWKVVNGAVTVSGDTPEHDPNSFQSTALPMRFQRIIDRYGSVENAKKLAGEGYDIDDDFAISGADADAVFEIVNEVLGQYNYPLVPSIPVATLGNKVPVDLPFFAETSAGMTADQNVVGGPFWWSTSMRRGK